MGVARTEGKLRGEKRKLFDRQQKELYHMYDTGDHLISTLTEVFSISQPTVYGMPGRELARQA
ncbi:hypothetical protein L905_19365 [Agrobacterium sp. TS43]|nr:hypothetical protein K538_23600 [Agrobacterium tumefaciens GW4]KVK45414.1 hypothetical protein L904_25925 [Agrobacterium sp. LY4]KVK45489.1 hypothetical protein L903_25940 [Agrobacterium sp. JL28]KVK58998.1 hypothetical protein L906_25855 [Agrobacterium sp. TS45]KVK63189.1 hypothetical protein L907_25470 [Agrobacterium sp. C13]KVK63910.1 hypothetical protein L905_19365 [Agrobacterium sp. TS43]